MAAPDHPARAYIRGVLDGDVVVGELVRLAVERHVADLKRSESDSAWPWIFDAEKAQHALDFFQFLRLTKGRGAGNVFELQPWQAAMVWVVFGWWHRDGVHRRFREAYSEVAKKNGKTTLMAGIALLGLVADDEMGADVYSAATTRDQAKICWGEAERMVLQSPSLKKMVAVQRSANTLAVEPTFSSFKPLGRDKDTSDGINPHLAVVDELHRHKDRGLYDIITGGTAARERSLVWSITTAGWNQETICWEVRKRAVDVLRGLYEDDSLFAFIATLDEGDDWADPEVWIKANPNLGVSVDAAFLERKARAAAQSPSARTSFLRLHVNRWTQTEEIYIPLEVWDRNAEAPSAPPGRPGYAALDLSTTTDLSALAVVLPPAESSGRFEVILNLWAPYATIQRRSHEEKVPYEGWADDGFIEASGDRVIDYDDVLAKVHEVNATWPLMEVAFDPWNATQTAVALQKDGFSVVEFRQGFASMSPAMKLLEHLLLEERIAHGGHPVLRWMCQNLTVAMDAAGNVKPDKSRSRDRIDGMVALTMALHRAAVSDAQPGPGSLSRAIEERGMRSIG